MRSLARILTAALSTLAFVGCDGTPVAPVRLPPGVSLAAVSNTIEPDFSIGPFLGCDGDVITGTATRHTVDASSSDGAGGLHINLKHQFQNMRLSGTPSGASYVGGWTDMTNAYIAPGEVLSGVVMQHFTINLIGQGQTPNLRLQGALRIVISANGVERVLIDTFTAVCR